MIFLIGKKVRCKNLLLKLKNSNYKYSYIEYISKNNYKFKGLSFTEKKIYEHIKSSENNLKIVFFINVSSILHCKWNLFYTFISHGGLLPKYRGASVINWQIINSEKFIGLSIIKFENKLDTGDIVKQTKLLNNKPLTLLRPKIDEWFAKNFIEISSKILSFKTFKTIKQKGKYIYWPNRTKINSLVNLYQIKDYLSFEKLVFACEKGYWLNFYINHNKNIQVSYCSKRKSSCIKMNNLFQGKIIKIQSINFSCYAIQA